MKIKNLFLASFLVGAMLSSCSVEPQKPVLTKMKCEYVPDGGVAVFYGKALGDARLFFPGYMEAERVELDGLSSNDTMLVVKVPVGTNSGKVLVENAAGSSWSGFLFRDSRNIIIDFDSKLATWGGFDPFDDGEKITKIFDGQTAYDLPAELPDPCSDSYGFLYGEYNTPWSMTQTMFLQYVANPAEGGRGNVSVAGVFAGYPIEQLALKFEVFVPAEHPYKDLRTEIFFGPFNAVNKHGRELVPIYHWEPYKKTGEYYTGDWQTITVPLTEFVHSTESDEKLFGQPIDLNIATNFTFVQFGDVKDKNNPTVVFLCVDNFRVVPIAD